MIYVPVHSLRYDSLESISDDQQDFYDDQLIYAPCSKFPANLCSL